MATSRKVSVMPRWSFTITASGQAPVSGAPADLGFNDLQADAVKAALALVNLDPAAYAAAVVTLHKTTAAGTRDDQTWYVTPSRRRPGSLAVTR